MIRLRTSFDGRRVLRGFGRIAAKTKPIIAQELNRQRTTFRSGTGSGKIPVKGVPRKIQERTSVKPLKRLRRRTTTPRGLKATPRKLDARGLTKYDTMPRRYFSGDPSGGKVLLSTRDGKGRIPIGKPFVATVKAGKKKTVTGLFRRFGESTQRLPINWAEYVDLTPAAYDARRRTLRELARAWPKQITDRFRSEFRGVFRRA